MRLIDADELREHLFVGFDYDRAIDDGIPKTEEEVLAFKCGWNDALKSVMRFAPTVDPVQHGQWIVNDNHHTCRCSCCESVELTDWALDQARYCPHCGAKMDEVEDDKG